YFNMTGPFNNTIWSYRLSVASQRLERDIDRQELPPELRDNNYDVTHFDSAKLQLGYQATESLELFATGGVENDYHRDGSVDRYGSALWNVGFRWASISNSLEARYGHRSFGSSVSVAAVHRGPGFDVSLAYQEDTTS